VSHHLSHEKTSALIAYHHMHARSMRACCTLRVHASALVRPHHHHSRFVEPPRMHVRPPAARVYTYLLTYLLTGTRRLSRVLALHMRTSLAYIDDSQAKDHTRTNSTL
jgi:hypothetical protein